MIGLFRARASAIAPEQRQLLAQIHCASCVAVRRSHGHLATLSLPYETDLLLTIGQGLKSGDHPRGERTVCTAVPVRPRRAIRLDPERSAAVAAFAVVAAWACTWDSERDHGRRRSAWLRRQLDPHLEQALHRLSIVRGTPPDPRLLDRVDESSFTDIDQFLAQHRPFVGGLWAYGLRAVGADEARGTGWSEELGSSLGDAMVLADALADREEDQRSGQQNPAHGPGGEEVVRNAIHHALVQARWRLSSLHSPWREFAMETVGGGLLSQAERRGARLGALLAPPTMS